MSRCILNFLYLIACFFFLSNNLRKTVRNDRAFNLLSFPKADIALSNGLTV